MNKWNLKLKTIPSTLAPKKMVLGRNLAKSVQDLHEGNHKIPTEETRKERRCFRFTGRRLGMVEMSVLLDFIYRFDTAHQDPSYSVDIDHLVLKFL